MCIQSGYFPPIFFDKCIQVYYTIHHEPETAMPNVTVSLPDELLKKARAAAEGQFRSLSQHVSFLIIQDAESRKPARRRQPRKPAAV